MSDIIILEDSPQQKQTNPPRGKRNSRELRDDANSDNTNKAKCGEDVEISPALLAKVRKMERHTSNNIIGTFFALTASAQNLLPGKPVTLSKEKLKNMVGKQGEGAHDTSKDPESAKKQDERSKKKGEKPVREWDLDKEDWDKDNNNGKDDFYCELCDAHANSQLTYETHVQGKRHQKKVAAALGERGRTSKEDSLRSKPDQGPSFKRKERFSAIPKIQRKIDDVDAPIIGLNCVSEIRRLDPTVDLTYYCKLCQSWCQPITVVDHLIGYKHRLYYLKENYHMIYEKVKNMNVKKSELSRILEEYANGIEKREGRGKMVVEEEVEERFSPEPYKRTREEPPRDSSYHSRDTTRDTKRHDSPVSIEQLSELIDIYPSSTRMEMLKELVDIDPQELRYSMDASRLETVIKNFKDGLEKFQGKQGNSNSFPAYESSNNSSLRGRSNHGTFNTDRPSLLPKNRGEGSDMYRSTTSSTSHSSRIRSESSRTLRETYQSSTRSGSYSSNR